MSLPSFVRRLGYIKPIEKGLSAFDPAAKPKAVVAAAAAPAAPAKKEAAKADDDDLDLFGSDDADEEAAENARQAAIDAKAKKSTKKAVIAMSLVMLEVKPVDDTTDLDKLATKIFAEITQDGLFWKT